jgi:hypothetical protein
MKKLLALITIVFLFAAFATANTDAKAWILPTPAPTYPESPPPLPAPTRTLKPPSHTVTPEPIYPTFTPWPAYPEPVTPVSYPGPAQPHNLTLLYKIWLPMTNNQ